ncbi:MAG: DUF4405 domain-containing protein [Candidatus Cloacimonadaceae bacterium]
MNLKLLKILNPLLFIVFLTSLLAVTIYKIALFPALQGSETVYQIHETAGIVFFILAVLHLILNWNWIKSQIFGIKNKPKYKNK